MVRGISDLLNDKDAAIDQTWQPIAARHAAAFGYQLLHTLDPPRRRVIAALLGPVSPS